MQHGIKQRLSCSYVHQQNGSIKGKHHHIIEVGLVLLTAAKLALKLGGKLLPLL